MIKKYIPHILLGIGLLILLYMMTGISTLEREGKSIMQPMIIGEAVVSILFMTVGITILLKRN